MKTIENIPRGHVPIKSKLKDLSDLAKEMTVEELAFMVNSVSTPKEPPMTDWAAAGYEPLGMPEPMNGSPVVLLPGDTSHEAMSRLLNVDQPKKP